MIFDEISNGSSSIVGLALARGKIAKKRIGRTLKCIVYRVPRVMSVFEHDGNETSKIDFGIRTFEQ